MSSMSAQQPRAYNYVAPQDFSTNVSAAHNQDGFTAPEYNEQHLRASSVSQPHYHPWTHAQEMQHQSAQSTSAPVVNVEMKPHFGGYQPAPFNHPSQQYGQQNFDE